MWEGGRDQVIHRFYDILNDPEAARIEYCSGQLGGLEVIIFEDGISSSRRQYTLLSSNHLYGSMALIKECVSLGTNRWKQKWLLAVRSFRDSQLRVSLPSYAPSWNGP